MNRKSLTPTTLHQVNTVDEIKLHDIVCSLTLSKNKRAIWLHLQREDYHGFVKIATYTLVNNILTQSTRHIDLGKHYFYYKVTPIKNGTPN